MVFITLREVYFPALVPTRAPATTIRHYHLPASQQLRSEGRKSSRVAICSGTRTRGSPLEHVTRCVGVGVQPHRDDLLLVGRLLAPADGDHLEEGAGRPLALTPGPRGLVRAAGPAWTSNSL